MTSNLRSSGQSDTLVKTDESSNVDWFPGKTLENPAGQTQNMMLLDNKSFQSKLSLKTV